MARRRKQAAHENHERWLVSYADFITLLFAFFVVMFATSQGDKMKAKQVSDSVKAALEDGKFSAVMRAVLGKEKAKVAVPPTDNPGVPKQIEVRVVNVPPPEAGKGPGMADLGPSLKLLTEELKEEIAAGRVQIAMEARGLAISFKEAALFPSGEYSVSPKLHPALAKVARAMMKVPNPVRLEGHTDSMPIRTGRFHSNWELSAARSIAVLELLTADFQVPMSRMSIGGYADTAPLYGNDTEEGRARNRRVDLIILNQVGVLGEPAKAVVAKSSAVPSG